MAPESILTEVNVKMNRTSQGCVAKSLGHFQFPIVLYCSNTRVVQIYAGAIEHVYMIYILLLAREVMSYIFPVCLCKVNYGVACAVKPHDPRFYYPWFCLDYLHLLSAGTGPDYRIKTHRMWPYRISTPKIWEPVL